MGMEKGEVRPTSVSEAGSDHSETIKSAVTSGTRFSRASAAGDLRAGACTCGGHTQTEEPTAYPFVYALGRIHVRFPSLEVEKEFAQAAGRAETSGLTDPQVLHTVLSKRQNRYLARNLCWVLSIQGLDSYILQPRDIGDFELLIDSQRPVPSLLDLNVIIGLRGPIAPLGLCNGLMVPIVFFDQLYSFDREMLLKAIPHPEKVAVKQFEAIGAELLDRIAEMADNAGASDEHRAINYLIVRYAAIYALAAERHSENNSLTGVEVRRSPLSGIRKIVEVIFSYTNRTTDLTLKYYVLVDVTGEFPFLFRKLSPYFDHA